MGKQSRQSEQQRQSPGTGATERANLTRVGFVREKGGGGRAEKARKTLVLVTIGKI